MMPMKEWIFKLIWMPGTFVLMMCAGAVLTYIFKDTGWDVPFRWLCIIVGIALLADYVVNR